MKKTLLLAMGLSGMVAFAQTQENEHGKVGINTSSPKASLDINAITSDNAKGILVPRITATEMKEITPKLTADQNSMMSYLTEEFPTTERTGSYILVSTAGYYYWNSTNTRWERLIVDMRMVGTNNHITNDSGLGGNGTSAGTGSDNIAIGSTALNGITTGSGNVAIGKGANSKISSHSDNVAIGINSLRDNINSSNVAIGSHSMLLNTSGSGVAIGANALRYQTTGTNNVAIGTNAMSGETPNKTNITGSNNIAIGGQSLSSLSTGGNNIGIGNNALNKNTTGSYNVVLGANALQLNTEGSRNFALGESALKSLTGEKSKTSSNIALGVNTLSQLKEGQYNIAIGDLALEKLDDKGKNYNIGIGYSAGLSAGTKIGGGVIILGNDPAALETMYTDTEGNINNTIAIGNGINLNNAQSNTVVIGNAETTDREGKNKDKKGGVDVGIGVYKPKAKLDVNGAIRINDDTNNAPCTNENAGTIRFKNSSFEGCTGTSWVKLHQ